MKLGNVATGDDFWGRETELAEIWRYLKKEHLTFPGVRRLGKSSLLQRLAEQSAQHGVLAKVLDLSTLHTASDFVKLLDVSFPPTGVSSFVRKNGRAVKTWLANLASVKVSLPIVLGGGGVEFKFQDKTTASWLQAANTLQQRLQNQPLLILLDEFPIMLQHLLKTNVQEAEQVLLWLRTWRQDRDSKCRFVFTGSIGLQNLLERHGMVVHMNDCRQYDLGPFTRKESIELWQTFAPQQIDHLKTPPSVIEAALQRIGWLAPYYVCLMLDASCQAAQVRIEETGADSELTQADIDAGYETLLSQRSRFSHWEQRLKDTLPKTKFTLAQAVLTMVSKRKEGLSLIQLKNRLMKQTNDASNRAQQIQDTLAYLTDEGYTTPPDAQGRVQFRSFLLRDWWSRNHV